MHEVLTNQIVLSKFTAGTSSVWLLHGFSKSSLTFFYISPPTCKLLPHLFVSPQVADPDTVLPPYDRLHVASVSHFRCTDKNQKVHHYGNDGCCNKVGSYCGGVGEGAHNGVIQGV